MYNGVLYGDVDQYRQYDIAQRSGEREQGCSIASTKSGGGKHCLCSSSAYTQ